MSRIAHWIRQQLSTVRPGRRATLIFLILATFTAVGTSAWAYWTAPGTGSGHATNGTLNAPINLAASATIGASAVHLTWDGSTLSTGPAAQGYYVIRTRSSDGSRAGACASSAASPTSATTCTDSAVPDGTFRYTVTAVYNSWTATSGPSNPVSVRTASKLAFTTAPSPTATSGTAMAAQPVVTVQDADGNTITTDTSSVTLTLTNPAGASLICAANPTAATSGVASFTGCKIDKTGTYTLAATDGSLTPATSSITITAGAPTTVAVLSGSAQSATVAQGFSSPLVALVTDANANPVPGATVTFTAPASGASGTFANITRTTTAVTGTNGQAASSVFTANTTAGTYGATATAGSGTATFTLANTAAAATKFVIASAPVAGSASANATLGPITVQRQDSFGNPVPAPAGGTSVSLSSGSAGTKVFAATLNGTSVTFVTIPAGASSVTFYYGDTKAGSPLITASGSLTSATQTQSITAAAAAKLAITSIAVSGVKSSTANLGPITVQERDSFDNPVTATTGGMTVNLLSTTPSSGTAIFATSVNGTSVTTVTIPAGASTTTFYYGYTKSGSPAITVSSGSLTNATQTESITN